LQWPFAGPAAAQHSISLKKEKKIKFLPHHFSTSLANFLAVRLCSLEINDHVSQSVMVSLYM
jgi:hypothetical protein